MNTKNKTYTIETLNQICNIVNDDNIELLITDFAGWLMYYNSAIKKVREQLPDETKNKNNTEIANAKFIWTDDAESKITGVTITEKTTGETTNVKF